MNVSKESNDSGKKEGETDTVPKGEQERKW